MEIKSVRGLGAARFIVLLIVVAFMGLGCVFTGLSQAGDVTLSINSASAAPGAKVCLSISLAAKPASQPASAVSFDLTYDTNYLKYLRCIQGMDLVNAGINSYVSVKEPTPGKISFVIVEMGSKTVGAIPSGEIFKLFFDVSSTAPGGNTSLAFIQPGVVDKDNRGIATTAINGLLTVAKP